MWHEITYKGSYAIKTYQPTKQPTESKKHAYRKILGILSVAVTIIENGVRQPRFKSWKKLLAFHFTLMPYKKECSSPGYG